MDDEEAGAEEVEVVGAMFPGPDGEPPPGVTAAAAALRSRQPAAFSLRLPLPAVRCPPPTNFLAIFFLSFLCPGTIAPARLRVLRASTSDKQRNEHHHPEDTGRYV